MSCTGPVRRILGCRLDGPTLAGALDLIRDFIASGRPHQIVTLNAEMAYRASEDALLRDIINRAALVTPDGAGVVWASRLLGSPVPERVAGVDLVEGLAARAAREGWRLFLYGAAPGVAEKARERLLARYPSLLITGTAHGYLSPAEEKELLARLRQARPDVLLVALGSPRQEYWIDRHLKELGIPVAMGVGGTLDVLAGEVSRAPQWMQRLGLEWLYRVAQDPRRVKRVLALPKFILKVGGQALKARIKDARPAP
ncbi:MAG: WecB/TagA/CpsF family glycosyltransferase [Thermoanaerobacteraceae bacterium]|nr:WecB/TagA/CpsF family glycosyltransferase [Thermoanaerobacteraceae bacterium]